MDKNSRFAASTRLFRVAMVSGVVALVGCGGGSTDSAPIQPPVSGPPPAIERQISPSTVDPAADQATEVHFSINPSPSVTAVNKLFVFLPGTQGVPDLYKLIVREGSAKGYHAIGLNYVNDIAVGRVCSASLDADCFWKVRREVIDGADRTDLVSVNPSNSIITRLEKYIAYLDTNFADEGWGQYLKGDGTVDWSKVVMGGHSQGGGHAGVMAKLYKFTRACYFASPPDWDGGPADWVGKPNVTPPSAQFGFAGLSDDKVPYNELSLIWQTLGLSAVGAAVSVDSNASPYSGSHMLTTNAQPDLSSSDPGTPLHGLTVRDAFTPKNSSGKPTFIPVWDYLCFR